MSFKTQETSDAIELELFDNRSPETSVTPQSSASENGAVASPERVRRRHSALACACADDCPRSSDMLDSGSAAEDRVESRSSRNNSERLNIVEHHFAVDATYADVADEVCSGRRGSNHTDANNSNARTDVSSLVADTSSDLTSAVWGQDECAHVSFTSDIEFTEDTDKPSGLYSGWYAKHKTDGRFMKPMRHMSILDRKSRPVPLPRSNTFRAKGAGDIVSSVPNRCSIPVQYESCSSLRSKLCQTASLGDESDAAYSLPLNFSEIYVDHRTVKELPCQQSGEPTAEIPSYESEYDVVRQSCDLAAGIPRYESDYAIVREDIWSTSDDCNTSMNRDPDNVPGSIQQSCESDYDVLKDDIWDDFYDGLVSGETETGTDVVKELDSGSADRWNHMSEKSSNIRPSLPVDVCFEEIFQICFCFIVASDYIQ